MNNTLKTGLLTLGLGIIFCSPNADAAVATHSSFSNAVNNCQAFTPGVSNTIRNRVIGAENIGSPIALACNFNSLFNGAAGNTQLQSVALYFSNGGAATTVTCVLLTGMAPGWSSGSAYTVSKSVAIGAGGTGALSWTAADNPNAGATDLGNLMVGVNCTMATNMTLSGSELHWTANNGV